jgi:hypothetical protein
MKQTPVEFLVKLLNNLNDNFNLVFKDEIEQAKEMEKQQQGYSEEDMKKCWDACLDFNKPAGFDNGIPFNEFLNNLKTNKI